MLIIAVRFVVKPEFLEQFKLRMREQARDSLAVEPDCHRFDIASDPEDPHKIFLYEIYSDDAAFQAHLASAHFKSFNTETEGWISSKAVEQWIGPWAQ